MPVVEDYLEKLSKSLQFLSSAFSFAAPQDNSINFKFLNFKLLIPEGKKKKKISEREELPKMRDFIMY